MMTNKQTLKQHISIKTNCACLAISLLYDTLKTLPSPSLAGWHPLQVWRSIVKIVCEAEAPLWSSSSER